MQGAEEVKKGEGLKRVVKLSDGNVLNRYWDDDNTPRQESYKEDTETAEAAALELAMRIKVASPEKLKEILDKRKADVCRELRAGACSGWDFSSRWFVQPDKIATIQSTGIVPVDLNCLLYSMETIIAKALKLNGKTTAAEQYAKKLQKEKLPSSNIAGTKRKDFSLIIILLKPGRRKLFLLPAYFRCL